jgi:hypothetical protein
MIVPYPKSHPIARIRQSQFAIRFSIALRLGGSRFDLHMRTRCYRAVLSRPANFSQSHQIHRAKSNTGGKRATFNLACF